MTSFNRRIHRAVDFAAQAHADQLRKEPDRHTPLAGRETAVQQADSGAPAEAKAISCADKIHNLQSCLLALERGADPWTTMNAGVDRQIPRYESVYEALTSDWDHPLLQHLRRNLDELRSACGYSSQ